MSEKITKKQVLILDFIKDFTDSRGFSPSYREIMVGLNLRSVSAVAEHVNNLVARGALRKRPGEARSLEVVDVSYPETVELFRKKLQTASDAEVDVLNRAAEILGIAEQLELGS